MNQYEAPELELTPMMVSEAIAGPSDEHIYDDESESGL